jgi:ABC-type sugar transport system ATPase subunit
VPAEVALVENAGSDAYVNFLVGEARLTARFAGRSSLRTGERVRLALDPARLTFFDARTTRRIE